MELMLCLTSWRKRRPLSSAEASFTLERGQIRALLTETGERDKYEGRGGRPSFPALLIFAPLTIFTISVFSSRFQVFAPFYSAHRLRAVSLLLEIRGGKVAEDESRVSGEAASEGARQETSVSFRSSPAARAIRGSRVTCARLLFPRGFSSKRDCSQSILHILPLYKVL